MKFVYKNILLNSIVSLVILLMGQYFLYIFLKGKIEKETIEHLKFESFVMKTKLKSGVPLQAFKYNIGDELTIEPIAKIQYSKPIIKDVLLIEQEDGAGEEEEHEEEERFTSKAIVFDVSENQKNYRVSILKAVDEEEGLLGLMSGIFFVSGLSLLITLIIVNLLMYYKLFFPLYKLIKDVKSFSIQQLKKIIPPKTTTAEFVWLGNEISRMSEKMISDFTSMKEFTENMTHEIQTPLAVINTKIERCLQDKNLTEQQSVLLSDALKAVTKLFQINKGLTLLSKLDNKQFDNLVKINLKNLVEQRIGYFSDFLENKKIQVISNFENEIDVLMNLSLAEILIDNLLKNAIQHNVINGKIEVSIKENQLVVSNTGDAPTESSDKLFNRFYSKMPGQSLGLGLSIVKKIGSNYNFIISYNYQNGLHHFIVDFPKNKK